MAVSQVEGALGYTDRGTAIVNSNTEMGKNSFLQLLVAQLKNLDPTQDQDSTAYITQMAQFASIEQLNNLNDTMTDFANQQKVGQVAILNELDSDGYYKWGIITQVFKEGTSTYVKVTDSSSGLSNIYDIDKVIGTADPGNSSAVFETAINSKYLAAEKLASSNAYAVLTEIVTQTKRDEDNNIVYDKDGIAEKEDVLQAFKCQITGAYLDKTSNVVKINIKLLDSEGNPTGEEKVYDYDDVIAAGNISQEALDEMVNSINKNTSTASAASSRTATNLEDNSGIKYNTASDLAHNNTSYNYPGITYDPDKDKKTENENDNDKTTEGTEIQNNTESELVKQESILARIAGLDEL